MDGHIGIESKGSTAGYKLDVIEVAAAAEELANIVVEVDVSIAAVVGGLCCSIAVETALLVLSSSKASSSNP